MDHNVGTASILDRPPAATGAREPLHVVMVSDVYFPRINGVSTSIQTFRNALQERNVRVTLVAPDYGYDNGREQVVRIPSRQLPVDPEDRMMRFGALMRRLEALPRPDVIHIQTPFLAHYAGVRWARRLGVPTVESYHTFFEEYLYHYVRFLPRRSLRFLARRFSASQCNNVDALVIPSHAMLNVLRDYGVTTPAEVIPTGLDLDAFQGGDGNRFRQAHGIAPRRPALLYVGRVVFEKNIEFLFHMTAELRRHIPDILLIVAGEGPAVPAFKARVHEQGLDANVLFVGYLDRQRDLLDCYKASDVFVFSSRTETQGLVLLEAMALGVPVVSTAVMGTAEVLRDGEGCLVAEEDTVDFTAKVRRLLDDTALRRSMGLRARQYASGWSEGVFADKLTSFYERWVADRL